MLRTQAFGREPCNVERVDGFEDLVEDEEGILLLDLVGLDVPVQPGFKGLSHEASDRLVGDFLLYLQEVLREEIFIELSENCLVELETLGDAQFVDAADFDELSVEEVSLLVVGLANLDVLSAESGYLLAGDL